MEVTEWDIVYFKAADGTIPGADFLDACPDRVRAKIVAVLDAVAKAPPPSFPGGGFWEAMHGDMSGFHEVRAPGPGQNLYRLFCILDRDEAVRELGDQYLASSPRNIG